MIPRMFVCLPLIGALLGSSVADSSSALAGIAHVAFRVSDVQKSRDFYESLGFEPAFEFADAGKPEVSFVKINDHQFIELYARSDASQPTGLLHVCYEATDIQLLRNEYVKRGLNPSAAHKARAGNLLFSMHDPEGQTLEYTQYLPGSLHFEDRGKHLSDRRISRHLLRVVAPVQDVAAELHFYISQLAFENIGDENLHRLRLPGHSNEELQLEAAGEPGISLVIDNLDRAMDDLRGRGLTVHSGGDFVSVRDPDGTWVRFVLGKHQ